MKKIITLALFVLSISAFASFIDVKNTELMMIDKLHQNNINIEDTIKFESVQDSIQYDKNKKLDQKLDDIKLQQILLDSLIKSKQ